MLASGKISLEQVSGRVSWKMKKAGNQTHKHTELAAGEDAWAAGIWLSNYNLNYSAQRWSQAWIGLGLLTFNTVDIVWSQFVVDGIGEKLN